MALQRSLLLCGLLWWFEGVASPIGPPSLAVSHPLPVWHEARHRYVDPSPHNKRDHRGYHPQIRNRGSGQLESSFRTIPIYEQERSYRTADQTDRQDVYNGKKETLNRHDRNLYNLIENRAFLERGIDKSYFRKQNNNRYDVNDNPYVERMFVISDPLGRRNEVVNVKNQQRNDAAMGLRFSPDSRHQQQGQSNSFNGGGSYTQNNLAASPLSTATRYHFIENTKTGRESNLMHHHQPSSSNARHFRFLSDGFRGPISSGHYEDVPGASGGYYRRPGGLINNYKEVTSSYQPKSPSPLLQSNHGNEAFHHRDARAKNSKKILERTSGGYHESYFQGSAPNDGLESDRRMMSDPRLQQEEHLSIPIQPQLLIKEVELPNPQPLDTSSHHPYSLLYFHYIPQRNSS